MTKYEELLNAWRREKENSPLQSMPEGFYVDMTEYI